MRHYDSSFFISDLFLIRLIGIKLITGCIQLLNHIKMVSHTTCAGMYEKLKVSSNDVMPPIVKILSPRAFSKRLMSWIIALPGPNPVNIFLNSAPASTAIVTTVSFCLSLKSPVSIINLTTWNLVI